MKDVTVDGPAKYPLALDVVVNDGDTHNHILAREEVRSLRAALAKAEAERDVALAGGRYNLPEVESCPLCHCCGDADHAHEARVEERTEERDEARAEAKRLRAALAETDDQRVAALLRAEKAEAERDALRDRIAAGTEGWAAIKAPTGCIAFVWSRRHQVWCLPSEYVGRVLILDDPETKPTQPACWPAPVAGEGGNE